MLAWTLMLAILDIRQSRHLVARHLDLCLSRAWQWLPMLKYCVFTKKWLDNQILFPYSPHSSPWALILRWPKCKPKHWRLRVLLNFCTFFFKNLLPRLLILTSTSRKWANAGLRWEVCAREYWSWLLATPTLANQGWIVSEEFCQKSGTLCRHVWRNGQEPSWIFSIEILENSGWKCTKWIEYPRDSYRFSRIETCMLPAAANISVMYEDPGSCADHCLAGSPSPDCYSDADARASSSIPIRSIFKHSQGSQLGVFSHFQYIFFIASMSKQQLRSNQFMTGKISSLNSRNSWVCVTKVGRNSYVLYDDAGFSFFRRKW